MLVINEREDGVVALHLPSGILKTCNVLMPVPRCEHSTYQPIGRRRSHCVIGASNSVR